MNRHQKNDPVEKYKTYLRLERGLSENTVEAYLDDLKKLFRFADEEQRPILQIEYADLQQFVAQLYDLGISTRSQARIISGIKSFYRFLVLEDYLSRDRVARSAQNRDEAAGNTHPRRNQPTD